MAPIKSKSAKARQAAIKAAYRNGQLTLVARKMPIPQLSSWFQQVLGIRRLVVANAELNEDDTALVVTGKATLLGSKNVGVRITSNNDPSADLEIRFGPATWKPGKIFASAQDNWLGQLGLSDIELVLTCPGDPKLPLQTGLDGAVDSIHLQNVQLIRPWSKKTLKVQWNAPEALKIPGIDWISLANLTMEAETGLANADVSGSLSVDLQTGGFVFPLIMPLPVAGDNLELRGNFDQIDLPSLTDVTKLLGLDGLPDSVSVPLEKLGQFSISDFRAILNPKKGSVPYLAVEVQSSVHWQAIPNLLEFKGFSLMFETVASAGSARTLYCSLNGLASVCGADAELSVEFDDNPTFFGQFDAIDLAQLSGSLLPSVLPQKNLANINLFDLAFSLSSNGDFSFGTRKIECEFGRLAQNFGIALPDNLESIGFSLLLFKRLGDTWNLNFESNQAIPLIPNEAEGIAISEVALKLSHDKTKGTNTECSFTIDGGAVITDDVLLQIDQLKFSWQQSDSKWSVDGGVTATIVGKNYHLNASVEKSKSGYSIALRYPTDIPLSDLGGQGHILLSGLSIFVEQVKQKSGVQNLWGIGGTVNVKSGQFLDVTGQLAVERGAKGAKLKISAKAPKIPNIPLSLGGELPQSPELKISLQDFALSYTKSEEDSAWAVSSSATMQIVKIPSLLKRYLPAEKLPGDFQADAGGLKLGFGWPSTIQFSKLGLNFASGRGLNLGIPKIVIKRVEIELGENTQLTTKMQVNVPSELNYVFGKRKNNKPNFELFNPSFEAELVLGENLSFKTITSPLKPLTYIPRDGKWWTEWNFGKSFGRYEFQVPEFSYSGGRWKASGGFNRLDKFRLPLTPIKFLLQACQFPSAFAKVIPDSIELENVDLNDGGVQAHIQALLVDVVKHLDKNLVSVLDEALKLIEELMQLCPDRLREYFVLQIPQSFEFDIDVDSAGGGTRVALRVKDGDDPIKLLLPFMTLTPELLGLTFKGLAFGQKSGGALLDIHYDGHIDRFNLFELTAALTLAGASPKGQPIQLSNRLILNKTHFLLPTGFPIPIPLFFDELGWEYRDIFETELQTHWYYPDPELTLFEYLQLLKEIYTFCIEHDYLLHKHGFGGIVNTKLTIGYQEVKLPIFLGGGKLEPDTHNVSINTADSAARILDSLKTGNASYAIEAVPIEYKKNWIRVGTQTVNLGILEMKANWCIATQREYEKVVLPAIEKDPNLKRALSTEVLKQLPPAQQKVIWDKGFIIILGGEINLGVFAGLEGQFGMALTGGKQTSLNNKGKQVTTGGFETGFLLAGNIGNDALKLEIKAHLLANPDLVQLDGTLGLYCYDWALIEFKGLIRVADGNFYLKIQFKLTELFILSGELKIGKDGFSMGGGFMLAGVENHYDLLIDNSGVQVTTKLSICGFGGGLTISCPGKKDGAVFDALATIEPGDAFNKLFKNQVKALAKTAAVDATEAAYQEVEKAMQGIDGIKLDIASLRKSVPVMCDTANKAITKAINAAAKDAYPFGYKVKEWANQAAAPFRKRIARIKAAAKAPNDKFRPEMKAAIQDLINPKHNQINIKKGPLKIYQKNPVIGGKNLWRLQFAVKHMDQLPDKDGPTLKKDYIQNHTDRDRMLVEVRHGIESSFPQIHNITFESDLGLFNDSGIKATLNCSFGGNQHSLSFKLDLSSPGEAVKSIKSVFG